IAIDRRAAGALSAAPETTLGVILETAHGSPVVNPGKPVTVIVAVMRCLAVRVGDLCQPPSLVVPVIGLAAFGLSTADQVAAVLIPGTHLCPVGLRNRDKLPALVAAQEALLLTRQPALHTPQRPCFHTTFPGALGTRLVVGAPSGCRPAACHTSI